jgi:hypothetical protein
MQGNMYIQIINFIIHSSFWLGSVHIWEYVSRMYGGRASDKCIASDSEDLFQNLESSKSSIMAVGGFLISGIINNINFNMSLFG